MELKDSKTRKNLMKAFAGESQARTRYTYYASIAKKEGYVQIANIFMETAENEKEHAKVFYKHLINNGLNKSSIDISASFPAFMGDTIENLLSSADGEHEEWDELYPEFAKVAKAEGFPKIARSFEEIAKVEKHHEARYRTLVETIIEETIYKKEEKVLWKCNNCGYILYSSVAPAICPACEHPRGYFQIEVEKY